MIAMNNSERMACNSHLLRTFLAIAECQNITRAAELLGRTQSAISVQAKTLEDTLGVTLFVRQSKGMTLTAEGEKLLPAAHQIVSDLTRLGTMFEDPLQGRIRVGIPDDYAESVLESVLVEFADRHPNVEVSARFGCTSQFATAIRNNQLDVAVASAPNAKKADQLVSEPNRWFASSELKIGRSDTVPLAILDRDCSWRDFATDSLTAAGRNWRIAYASENFSGVKSATRSGLAVSVLPKLLKDSTMVELGEADGFPALPSTERAIISARNAPKEITQAMIDAIKSATRQLDGRPERPLKQGF